MDEYGVIDKLWGFCNILRDDGIGYGDYIEQLTYLLFLKLAEERGVEIPKDYDWQSLKKRSGTELREHYQNLLNRLADEKGLLGDIFAGSLSRFREPVNLKRLITMIDEIQWSETDVDIKAAAYEGLLRKYAEEQKGAGQYFTPREVIRSIIRCMKPNIREKADFSIHDPACGTGGFLIGAYEWMLDQTNMGADLKRDENERLRKKTFSGQEIVLETRRLAFMNLYLHEIETEIEYGDSLSEGPHTGRRHDCILTNPPFGRAGSRVERADFTVETSNKQLNFVQHVMTILKPGGRAAMVVPDNVLFESGAGQKIRKIMLDDCNLHTILRLPVGTFTPYSSGVKANVIFFTKGIPTKETWIYDLRTNTKKITKSNPINPGIFAEFENCYGSLPNADKREEIQGIERFKKFTREQIEEREFNLDVTWLRDELLEDVEELPEPEEILVEIETLLQSAMESVDELQSILSNSSKKQDDQNEICQTTKMNANKTDQLYPDHWKIMKLGDVFDIIGGGTPSTKVRRYWSGKIPWITSADIHGLRDIHPRRSITHEAIEKSATNLVPEGTIIVVTRVALGKVALTDQPLCFSQDSQALVNPRVDIDSDFVLYFLSQAARRFRSMGRGTTISGITKKQLRELLIPLPPLEEQRIIARIIKNTLGLTESATQDLSRIPSLTTRLQMAIRSKALQGNLMEKSPYRLRHR